MLLKDKLKDCQLILASKSPRRRELLSACGLEYRLADDYEVEEIYPDDLTAEEVPLYLARLKSQAYPFELAEGEIVITADTVVVLGDDIIGKPRSREDAVAMLERLSGNRHTVVSGVALRSAETFSSFKVKTDVWFRLLNREEIEYYVDTFKPYDKAGAYGIQEWIGYVGIGRIEGSFYNVMGLPIQTLYQALERFIDDK